MRVGESDQWYGLVRLSGVLLEEMFKLQALESAG